MLQGASSAWSKTASFPTCGTGLLGSAAAPMPEPRGEKNPPPQAACQFIGLFFMVRMRMK